MSKNKLDAIRDAMKKNRLQYLLVTDIHFVRYLTNYSGSSGICLIAHDAQYFITDHRYKIQSAEEVRGYKILIAQQTLLPLIITNNLIKKNSNVGFESKNISFADYNYLKSKLTKCALLPADNIVINASSVKDENEISLIKKAVSISDKVFDKILKIIKVGVTELDVAAEISYWHKKFGAESDSFEPIVASGWRGALPHARASNKKIAKGEMLVLDFGCTYKGYNSDITRTVAIGKPNNIAKKIYNIVYNAQTEAISKAKSGMKAKNLDAVARNLIKKNGYGKYFFHSLGHGLGVKIHENLRLSKISKDILKEGNVVTIEPGIYIPNLLGIRIEDDVVIRKNNCEVLNKSPKELIIL